MAEITAYPKAVACNGIYYQRHGTSTLYVPDSSVEEFKRKRDQLNSESGNTVQSPEISAEHITLPSQSFTLKADEEETLLREEHQTVESNQNAIPKEEQATGYPEGEEYNDAEYNDTPQFDIASSRLRNNVLHDYNPGYQDVHTYLYFLSDLSILASDYDLYREETPNWRSPSTRKRHRATL